MFTNTLAQTFISLRLLGLYQERSRVDKMVAHVALSFRRIAPLDRFEDRLMKGQRVIAIHEL